MNRTHGLADRSEEARGQLDGFGTRVQYPGAAERFIERTQKGTSDERKGDL
jgi:hypothetical protein